MLIALLIAYFASHLSSDAASPLLGDPARLESALKHQVKDPVRLEQLKVLVADLKKADEERKKLRGTAVKAVDEVGGRQTSTAAEMEAAYAGFLEVQRALRDRQLALRLRLAALTTPAEWAAIVEEIFPLPPAPAR
jgi:hypothetical protein